MSLPKALSKEDLLAVQLINDKMEKLLRMRVDLVALLDEQEDSLIREVHAWRARAGVTYSVDPTKVLFDLVTGAIVPKD